MRSSLHRLALVAVIGAAGASCVTLYNARSGIHADPLFLEDRGEAVFRHYLIPVAERASNYRVYSGPFMVDEVWGAGAIEERVFCGPKSEGDLLARGSRIEMSVTLEVSYRNMGSSIALTSNGRTVPSLESEKAARCRLRESFVEEVLAAIVGDLPARPRDPGLPGTRPPGGA